MIYTKRLITIRNATASIDATVILYRGDKDVEIIFEIIDSKFKFESSSGNLINNSHAAYGQIVIACPNGGNTISDIMECENGLITFVMTASMMDELTEVGKYSFHIRLYNDDKTSRVTLPPVVDGIEIREPLVIDDNTVDNAMVGYSTIQTYGVEEPSFDENGNYMKTDWQTGDKITASKLNKIEETLDTINNDIPSKTSELVNDSGFLSSIPSEYITETELNAKGYLTEHQNLSDYAKTADIPTKTSDLTNDSNFLTSVPSEYVTETELNEKGYLTEHQDISGKADKTELPTKTSQLINDSGFLTNIPSEYVTETELNQKGYSTFNGDYNNLTNKPDIPSISGLASEIYVNEYVENAIKDIPKEEVDLSNYAKKTELPTKLSQLANDEGYMTSIPSEYVTEAELNSKGYATTSYVNQEIQTIELTPGPQGDKGDKGDKGEDGLTISIKVNDETYTQENGLITLPNISSSKVAYGTCSTEAATAEKVIVVEDTNWKLEVGSLIMVRFSVTNTASNVTLNVNNMGAYGIRTTGESAYTGSSSTYCGNGDRSLTYIFDGSYWQWISAGGYPSSTTNVSLGQGYTTCSTAASTKAKTASLSSYSLSTGGIVAVKFTNDVPASATLNINSKGAKAIYHKGVAITDGIIKAGDTATFIYSTRYHLISIDRDETFSGDYNDLTNKPAIPTKTSELTNDSGFISSIPEEYVTEQELSSKGLATETFVTNKILEAQLGRGEVDVSNSTNNNLSLGVHSDGGIYLFINGEPVGLGIFISNVEIKVSDGYITDDNTIILSDNIPSGTYSMKYENEDGSYTTIGNFEIKE